MLTGSARLKYCITDQVWVCVTRLHNETITIAHALLTSNPPHKTKMVRRQEEKGLLKSHLVLAAQPQPS